MIRCKWCDIAIEFDTVGDVWVDERFGYSNCGISALDHKIALADHLRDRNHEPDVPADLQPDTVRAWLA